MNYRLACVGLALMVLMGCASRGTVMTPTTRPVALAGVKQTVKTPMGTYEVPSLTAYLPTAPANGTAVIVCPGGGYGGLMDTFEGQDVCRWWNARGVTAFMLRYHLAPNRYPMALDDAQAAIRFVRENAKVYGVDTTRIGIMGFSAGGHLAGSAATMFHGSADRPDFAVLVYPVVSMVPPLGHVGSRNNLLGPDHPAAMEGEMSLERRVTAKTPPVFMVVGKNDKIVDWRNSAVLDDALRAEGVKEKLVVLENGQHGFGITMPKGNSTGDWREELWTFVKQIGVVR